MKVATDCFGINVRLTDERLAHILQRPEMAGMEEAVIRLLKQPAEVRLSRSDNSARLFYEFRETTRVSSKWLCAVVKYLPNDAFLVTAYLTDKMKAGEIVWPRR